MLNRAMWPPLTVLSVVTLIAVWIAYSPDEDGGSPHDLQPADSSPTPSKGPTSGNLQDYRSGHLSSQLSIAASIALVSPSADQRSGDDSTSTKVTIGEPLDPEDPAAWALARGDKEEIRLGEFLDANDPTLWGSGLVREPVYLGDYLDPDDPSTWPSESRSETVDIGPYYDPERPETWPSGSASEQVNIGDHMMVDDSSHERP